MTGGMAFVYDKNNNFEKRVNSESVIWQIPETDYWKNYLREIIAEHVSETHSEYAKKILDNFESEIKNFYQVCPKEMLDKLDNPITLKSVKSFAS